MTPDAQRIALAEARGYETDTLNVCHCGSTIGTHRCEGHSPVPMMNIDDLPDFLNDLNAVHKAKKALLTTADRQRKYIENLWGGGDFPSGGLHANEVFLIESASAPQCVKALLCALNLWKD